MIKFQFNYLFFIIIICYSCRFFPRFDGGLLLFLLIRLRLRFLGKREVWINWLIRIQVWFRLQVELLLLGKQGGRSFSLTFTLKRLFIFVIIINLSGLNIFLNQNFMGKLSLSLLIIALRFWLISYTPFLHRGKEKFRLFVIGEIKFPSLSFLLSNIEILTHLFRPITLTARLWVNIWVGHLLMRVLSTFFLIISLQINLRFIVRIILLGGFFLFETGIICLQAFVFRYLIGVYWQENLEHSIVEWH